MRYEGKHKEFKNAAKGTSFKNIVKTLSHHHQRLMAYNLHFNSLFAAVDISTASGEICYSALKQLLHIIAPFTYNIIARPVTSLSSLPYIDALRLHHPELLRKKLYRFVPGEHEIHHTTISCMLHVGARVLLCWEQHIEL